MAVYAIFRYVYIINWKSDRIQRKLTSGSFIFLAVMLAELLIGGVYFFAYHKDYYPRLYALYQACDNPFEVHSHTSCLKLNLLNFSSEVHIC